MKHTPGPYLVPLPVGPDGVHASIPIAGKATAEWLSRLIAFSPRELLDRAGPTPPHMEGWDYYTALLAKAEEPKP